MKTNIMIGMLLIAAGIAAFAYEGINYKTRETAVDLGSLQITAEKTNRIPISPIVGALAIMGGIVLLIRNPKTA